MKLEDLLHVAVEVTQKKKYACKQYYASILFCHIHGIILLICKVTAYCVYNHGI